VQSFKLDRSLKGNVNSLYFLIARLFCMALVAAALPVGYLSFGVPDPEGGPQAFSALILLGALGTGAAIVYLIVATIGYVAVHKKLLRTRLLVEAIVLFAFLVVLAYAGAIAGG
jgi:hypothetical protein